MATIRDVAIRAGVSTATVSRVLNGKSTVDIQLASRVRNAASELGYRPNILARNLRRKETSVITLIVSDVENPFFTALARGVEDTAAAGGYSVVLGNSDDNHIKEQRYVDVALSERAAGVIVSPTDVPGNLDLLLDSGTPVVAVDRPIPGRDCDSVLVPSVQAAQAATTHLLNAGYRRVGCVTGPPGIPTADDRLTGYLHALALAGISAQTELIRRADYRASGAQRAAIELLDQVNRPDALLVANSAMTLGVLAAMAERKLRAGRDIGLVCFDDTPWTTLVDPPISVVSQPAYHIGVHAMQLLLARIANPTAPYRKVTLEAELIERGSSRQDS